jgi:hypothetical protein
MLWFGASRLSTVNVATAILHRGVAAVAIGLLAFRPALWVHGKSCSRLLHEVAAVFYLPPPTFPMTACPLT